MKLRNRNSNYLVFLMVVLSLSLILNGCKVAAYKKRIVNHWKVVKMEQDVDYSDSPEHQEIFKRFEQEAEFIFNQDGTYHFNMVTEDQDGTWELKDGGKTLYTVASDGRETEAKIIELEENRFVISQENPDGNVIRLVLAPKE